MELVLAELARLAAPPRARSLAPGARASIGGLADVATGGPRSAALRISLLAAPQTLELFSRLGIEALGHAPTRSRLLVVAVLRRLELGEKETR